MPNPTGVNSFDRFSQEPPYGAVSQAERLADAYPTPGTSAINAPRRASQAGKGKGPKGQAQQQAGPPPVPQEAPQITSADMWAQIAAIPGASDLVKQYAAMAQRG